MCPSVPSSLDLVPNKSWFLWPSDRCCVGAAVCSDLKGLADKQNPLDLRAEGRKEGKQKRGDLQRLRKLRVFQEKEPRKMIALIVQLLPFVSEAHWPLAAFHKSRSASLQSGSYKGTDSQEVVGLGCDAAILRCLIRWLPAISARLPTGGLGKVQTTGTTGIFYQSIKASESNEGIQMVGRGGFM